MILGIDYDQLVEYAIQEGIKILSIKHKEIEKDIEGIRYNLNANDVPILRRNLNEIIELYNIEIDINDEIIDIKNFIKECNTTIQENKDIPNVWNPKYSMYEDLFVSIFYKKGYIEFLSLVPFNSKVNSNKIPDDELEHKKVSEKYYALLHCLKIAIGGKNVKDFKTDPVTDQYPREEIKSFAKEKYKFKTSGETFYKYFISIDINDTLAIANTFKDYKTILAKISGNDKDIITHIKGWPS